MKQFLASVILLLFSITFLKAGDETRLFAEGNKAYQNKDYSKAIEIYQQLLEGGWRSADLEYNLGNACYRSGSAGRAILHFERALLLEPDHKEAKWNLDFLSSKINGEIEPLPTFFLTEWWKNARMALSSFSFSIIGLTIWWLGFAGLGICLMGKTRGQRKWGLIGGICLLLLSLLPVALALSRTHFEKNTHHAILIQKSAILRSGPEDAAEEIQTLPEGVKLQLVTNLSGWWQVELANGEIGWLPEQVMERI